MYIYLVSAVIESLPCVELFKRLSDISVFEVTNLSELPNKKTQLDLVFFDARLGVEEITQQIQVYQQKNQTIKWLLMNASDIQQSLQCLQLGALGVLTKPSEKTIQNCLHSTANDQLYLEVDFIQILALRQIKKTLVPFQHLTAREYDVFCMLAEDYSIQTIAKLLLVTAKTAFNYQAQVRRKLKLSNQQQIFDLAKTHGLVN